VNVLGRPDYTYTLTYPGGYGGEFLCYWLGQHAGCVPVPIEILPNNRYTIDFDQIRIHPRAPESKLFLPGHNVLTGAAKNKFVPTSTDRIIGVRSSITYQKFYFVLFAAKTLLYKYSIHAPIPESVSTTQFLEYIHPRTEFYHHEFDAWRAGEPVPALSSMLHKRFIHACRINDAQCDVVSTAEFSIDLDQLFFGNLVAQAVEYQRVCDHLNIQPDLRLLTELAQYHARNIDLVTHMLNMLPQDLIAMTNQEVWPIILDACVRLAEAGHSLV